MLKIQQKTCEGENLSEIFHFILLTMKKHKIKEGKRASGGKTEIKEQENFYFNLAENGSWKIKMTVVVA